MVSSLVRTVFDLIELVSSLDGFVWVTNLLKTVGVFVKPCKKTRVHRDFSTGELCPNAFFKVFGTTKNIFEI